MIDSCIMFAINYKRKCAMNRNSAVGGAIGTAAPAPGSAPASGSAPATGDASACPRMEGLPASALAQVAMHFQALADPTRLQLLDRLRLGERNVGELAQLCGTTSANVSRHLAVLTQQGLVERQSRGTSAYYRIADASVYELCDLVCGAITRQLEKSVAATAAFSRSASHT